ncbi:MAG: hypothetical protein SOV56_01470 [Phascolarctobacterium sp.]|nr:hypothetical protein [Phascolarctobacterium sp.]
MKNAENISIEQLIKRVEVLEEKLQMLSQILLQAGQAVEITAEVVQQGNEKQQELEVNVPIQAAPVVAELPTIAKEDEEGLPMDVEQSLFKSIDLFREKYASGNGEYHLYLDIAKDLIKELKKYLDWKQVPGELKERICLEEAYDSNMFYADCEQIQDEFIYFVAPAEPDMKYSQRDFIRLALPYFFDITYVPALDGKLINLQKPAVFVQDDKGTFILKMKGKIALAR